MLSEKLKLEVGPLLTILVQKVPNPLWQNTFKNQNLPLNENREFDFFLVLALETYTQC